MIHVYCHTSPSGKSYVGIASQGWRSRWRSHVFEARRGSPLPLHAAIRKYGKGAFKHWVLRSCRTREEAELAECRLIAHLGTKIPGGYNATAGGEGVRGLVLTRPHKQRPPVTEETRARMRASHLGVKRGPHSAQHRARLSAAHTGKTVSPQTRAKLRVCNLGKKHSAATRNKMSLSHQRERRQEIAAEVLYAQIHGGGS